MYTLSSFRHRLFSDKGQMEVEIKEELRPGNLFPEATRLDRANQVVNLR